MIVGDKKKRAIASKIKQLKARESLKHAVEDEISCMSSRISLPPPWRLGCVCVFVCLFDTGSL